MDTKRLAGMIGIAAVVTLGVVGVDRLNKDAKARSGSATAQAAAAQVAPPQGTPPQGTPSQVTPQEPAPLLPAVRDSFQVDPSGLQLPPIPKESDAPPLISTGELEKKLKQSIDNLQKVLPPSPSVEESSLPPPPLPALPETPSPAPPNPSKVDDKSPPSPAPLPAPVPVAPAPAAPSPPAPVTAPDSFKPIPPPSSDDVRRTEPVKPPSPEVPPIPAPPPPGIVDSEAPKPANIAPNTPPLTGQSAASAQRSSEFQRRLNDLEIRYLRLTIAELERRLDQLPRNNPEHATLDADRKRMSERLAQFQKGAPEPFDGPADNVWALHMETVHGKTVVHAIVHQKARFKIICERLDLQAPKGTLLAVGQVQISGEGFKGQCDRLTIALHRDNLTLEGKAEVGIRTRPLPIVEERKDGVPPIVERRHEEPASTTVPILHLSGDHLDLRWSDLQPTAPQDTRVDEPAGPNNLAAPTPTPLAPTPAARQSAIDPPSVIRASAGPMVKVAFNGSRDGQWSEWGTLRRTAMQKDGQPIYDLEDRQGKRLAYVHTPAGMSLAEHVGKRVSVFGLPARTDDRFGQEVRSDGRPMQVFTVSHVAWE